MPAPTENPPVKQGNPLVVAALAIVLFGTFGGIVWWKRSTVVRGGPLTLATLQSGEIDGLGTPGRRVPGREIVTGDVADVWTIALEANQPYTVQVCTPSSARRRYNPAFVVEAPPGSRQQPVQVTGASPGGTNDNRIVVYTPTQAGTHSIWVYKPFNYDGGSYRIQVTRGARAEVDMSLCM